MYYEWNTASVNFLSTKRFTFQRWSVLHRMRLRASSLVLLRRRCEKNRSIVLVHIVLHWPMVPRGPPLPRFEPRPLRGTAAAARGVTGTQGPQCGRVRSSVLSCIAQLQMGRRCSRVACGPDSGLLQCRWLGPLCQGYRIRPSDNCAAPAGVEASRDFVLAVRQHLRAGGFLAWRVVCYPLACAACLCCIARRRSGGTHAEVPVRRPRRWCAARSRSR
jgi:hypothetical protein